MAVTHKRAKRKASGGRYISFRKKRIFETGSLPTLTKLKERKSKTVRTKGGSVKFRLLGENIANVYDPKTKKCSKVKIKNIVENPANRHFVRRNIMTKGTIIETEKGKAKITNAPGQENVVNAILIS